ALSALDRHARAAADSPTLLVRNAELRLEARDEEGALSVLQRARRRAPANLAVRSALAGALIRTGRLEAAQALARDRLAVSDAAGHALQGDVYAARGQWSDAAAAYARAARGAASRQMLPKQHGALVRAGQQAAAAALLARALR